MLYIELVNAETVRFRCTDSSLRLTFAHVSENTYRIIAINDSDIPDANERDDLFVQITRDGHSMICDAGDGIVTGVEI